MSIKPISSSRELLDKYHSGISVYAIPDTHRVFSVETLQRWRSGLVSGNQAYCLVPPAEIQAIIEGKPCSQS